MSITKHSRILILGLHSQRAFIDALAQKEKGEVLLVDSFKPPTINVEGNTEMKGNMRGIQLASLLGGLLAAGQSAAEGMRSRFGGTEVAYNPRVKEPRRSGRRRDVHYITHTKTPGPTRAQAKRLVKKAKGKATAKARNCYRSAKK